LRDYIKAAQPHKNLISITTNGTLLTYKKAKELKSWGVDIVTISYDLMRNEQVFWEAYFAAKKAGLKITVGVVAQRHKLRPLFWLRRFAEATKTICVIIFPVPIGKWQGQDVMLMDNEIEEIRELEHNSPYIRTDFQANYFRYGCGGAKEILFLNPYGDVFCCPFIQIPFSNVRQKSIRRIREEMFKIPWLKEYSQKCLAGEDGGIWKRFC
jgi:molybdenum cofactor biosynthesis enzyme MoaA